MVQRTADVDRRADMMLRAITAFLIAVSCLPGNAAMACSRDIEKLSPDQIKREAQRAVMQADVIVDAIVIEPMRISNVPKGTFPGAYLSVVRTFKGKPQPVLAVVFTNSCDILLAKEGEKVRVLLSGKDVYRADGILNSLPGPRPPEYNRQFAAAVDRILRKPRRQGYSILPGAPEAGRMR